MSSLVQHRCLNHAAREAVARCPECRRFFCRECITEHAGRVLCSACLAWISQRAGQPSRRFAGLVAPLSVVMGLMVAWLFFFGVGRVLLQIPSDWHEGTVWEKLAPLP